MIQLFCGEDTFESYTQVKKYLRKLEEEKNAPITSLNVDEMKSVDEILVEIEGVGLFSEEKIVFAKRLLKNKKITEYFTDNLDKLNQYEIVIWQDEKPDGRSKLVKDLKKIGQLKNFEQPKDWQLENWVDSIAKSLNVNLSKEQTGILVQRSELNKWIIYSELKKLGFYQKSKNQKVLSNAEFEDILGIDASGDIWKLTDYFGEKKFEEALLETKKLLQVEDNVQYIIAMLARELDLLASVKDAEINNLDLKNLKLHPFVLQKTLKKVKNFTKEEISNWMRKILDIDLKIRKGHIDGKHGLFELFYSV